MVAPTFNSITLIVFLIFPIEASLKDKCSKVIFIHLTDVFHLLISLFFSLSAVPAAASLGLLFGLLFRIKPLISFRTHVSAYSVLSLCVLCYFPTSLKGSNKL